MDERIQLMTNTFENQLIDSNGNFDMNQIIDTLSEQMINNSLITPKFDILRLFIERGLNCTVEEVENNDYLCDIDNLVESNYSEFIKELNDLFFRHYGLDISDLDLSDLYKLYKVLVLNFNSTVAHFVKAMGTNYNEFDDPEEYKLTSNITKVAIDSQSGEALDIMVSMENLQIIDKLEPINDSFVNLLTRCCNVVSTESFFYLASCLDIGNNDLYFVSDKVMDGTIGMVDRDFFSNRIYSEAMSPKNLEIIKKIYSSIS